jgi:hypothetical protein
MAAEARAGRFDRSHKKTRRLWPAGELCSVGIYAINDFVVKKTLSEQSDNGFGTSGKGAPTRHDSNENPGFAPRSRG